MTTAASRHPCPGAEVKAPLCELCHKPMKGKNVAGVCTRRGPCFNEYRRRVSRRAPAGVQKEHTPPPFVRQRRIARLTAAESRRVLVGALTAVEEAFRDLQIYAEAGRAAAVRCRKRIDDIYEGNVDSLVPIEPAAVDRKVEKPGAAAG